MGMGGNDSSVQISSNDIFANNVEEYKHSWSAGGMKLSNGNTLVIDGNHNHGNGVWTHVLNSPEHHDLQQPGRPQRGSWHPLRSLDQG
jgi:hypothetical protein